MALWTMGFLLPHAPILVPEVAARSGAQTGKTLEALISLGGSLKRLAPDLLLVLDPHAATERILTFVNADRFVGDLGEFGARSVSLSFGGAGEEGDMLFSYLHPHFPSRYYRPGVHDLDYAAVVSLHLLLPLLGVVPSMVLVNPVTIDFRQAFELGGSSGGILQKKSGGFSPAGTSPTG